MSLYRGPIHLCMEYSCHVWGVSIFITLCEEDPHWQTKQFVLLNSFSDFCRLLQLWTMREWMACAILHNIPGQGKINRFFINSPPLTDLIQSHSLPHTVVADSFSSLTITPTRYCSFVLSVYASFLKENIHHSPSYSVSPLFCLLSYARVCWSCTLNASCTQLVSSGTLYLH